MQKVRGQNPMASMVATPDVQPKRQETGPAAAPGGLRPAVRLVLETNDVAGQGHRLVPTAPGGDLELDLGTFGAADRAGPLSQ